MQKVVKCNSIDQKEKNRHRQTILFSINSHTNVLWRNMLNPRTYVSLPFCVLSLYWIPFYACLMLELVNVTLSISCFQSKWSLFNGQHIGVFHLFIACIVCLLYWSEFEGTQTATSNWSCKWVSFQSKKPFPLENYTFLIAQAKLKGLRRLKVKRLQHKILLITRQQTGTGWQTVHTQR